MSRSAAARAERELELRARYRAAKARELEDDGDGELAAELRAGRCACGCKTRLAGGNVRTFYVSERHRKAAHRRRLERLAEAAGVPARLSRRVLEQGNRGEDRPGDAPAPRKAPERRPLPGVRIYLPTLGHATRLEGILDTIDRLGIGHTFDTRELRDVILPPIDRRRARESAD